MDCTKARTILLGEETGQFPVDEIALAKVHSSECRECKQYFQYTNQFQEMLREKLSADVTPPKLREALLRRLAEIRKGPSKFKWLSGSKRWIGRVAAVIAVGLVGLFIVRYSLLQQRDEVGNQLVSVLIGDHIELQLRENPFDIQSSDRYQLEQWFKSRVDFAVSIPPVRDAAIRGGRLCYLLGKRAAFVSLEKNRMPLSTYILDGEGVDLSSLGEVVSSNHKRICRASGKGFNVVLWKSKGLIYAFVSSLQLDELEKLAATL